jgi:flagellar basal body-associated protein FliL
MVIRMKKNILTIIIMAMSLINIVLSAVIIFAIVPTANKTTQIVDKVASIINLELEDPDTGKIDVSVSDIVNHNIPDKLTINLKKSDDTPHFAIVYVSLSLNSKHKDFTDMEPRITDNENKIKEIVTEEFSKYTVDEVNDHKSDIKASVLKRIQEYFQSDFIIDVSFGNSILS